MKFRLMVGGMWGAFLLSLMSVVALAGILWGSIIAVCTGRPSAAPPSNTTQIVLVVALLTLAIAFSAFGFILLRIALKAWPLPSGKSLDRVQAPLLWKEIDRVARTLGVKRIHRLVVSDRLAASVMSRRSWLMFGWRHTIELGLPLLQLLPPEEVGAVIAHEVAHIRAGDTRLGRLVHRTSLFASAIQTLAGRSGGGLLSQLARRLAGAYDASTNRFRQESEVDADHCSATTRGSSVAARALLRFTVASARLDAHMPTWLQRTSLEAPEPPADHLETLVNLGSRQDPCDAYWLARELLRTTGNNDTYPCLAERLRTMGVEIDAATVPDTIASHESAASAWLGSLQRILSMHFSNQWQKRQRQSWPRRRALLARQSTLCDKLEQLRPQLGPKQLWDWAWLAEVLDRPNARRDALEDLVLADPTDNRARLALARFLLQQHSEEDVVRGLGMVESLAQRDAKAFSDGLQAVAEWHGRHGRLDAARRTLLRSREVSDLAEDAASSPITCPVLLPSDLLESRLDDAQRIALQMALRLVRAMRSAWIACVDAREDASSPRHLVVYRLQVPSWKDPERFADDVRSRLRAMTREEASFEFREADSLDCATLMRLHALPGARLM